MLNNIKGHTINNIKDKKNTYFTNDVAKMLGVGKTTVRKYSQNLENKGYSFSKGKGTGKRQARFYTESDIKVLRYLKKIKEETNISVEQATSVVIEGFANGEIIKNVAPNDVHKKTKLERYDEQYEELKKMINNQSKLLIKQSELILNLTEKLDLQEEYINKQSEDKLNKVTKQ